MSVPETELPQAATAAAGLRRNLKLWQVVAVSIGVMAPSLAISLEPQGAVSTVGRAIPLTYLLALAGVLLVSYGFARLALALAALVVAPRMTTRLGQRLAADEGLAAPAADSAASDALSRFGSSPADAPTPHE